ncbi:ceramide synthase-like isoform X2 [Scophthalmus maximus]|uniref:ceramide synthase-like isoform X2 n=1 Tax=Scophthalmus maximus TaxID=52904 RepID=UPI001FA865B7|nr:ceramide synthase-like isoform X2 [Scophthalmus maximus]
MSSLVLVAAGSVFFPGLFLWLKRSLRLMLGWSEGEAAVMSTRLVSSLQAVMASSAGCVIVSSCSDVMDDRHWLTEVYILFASPYFAYDIYAMFVCHRHKLQVKGHEEETAAAAVGGARSTGAAVMSYLRSEFLMVLHHVFMVAFCFPTSLLWRQGKGDYFQGVLFLAELSTPSVCFSKVLIQLQSSSLPLPLLHLQQRCVLCFRYASIPLSSVPLVAPWQCNLGAALLWPLQLYWFSLICRGAVRMFSRRLNSSSETRLKDQRD